MLYALYIHYINNLGQVQQDLKQLHNGPNPLRTTAKGRRMYTSFIKVWGDDVSGNQSKQYNAHTNIYFSHANLPHDKQSQEYFVRFASTSPHTTAGEQFDGVVKQTVTISEVTKNRSYGTTFLGV